MNHLSRRRFLIASAGMLASISVPALGTSATALHAQRATAITQVFGDGVRLTAVAVEYDAPIESKDLRAETFRVEGRTVTGAFTSTSTNPADKSPVGRFAIVTLAPTDANAALSGKVQPENQERSATKGKRGPGYAGDIPTYDTVYKPAEAIVRQTGPVMTVEGRIIPASPAPLATTAVKNLIVDEFRQLEFDDPKTGKRLRYNLFVPKDYDARKSYPLVLFMHDAGATSDIARTTLFQGLGAIAWASPEDQARRPCFIVAPQYAEIIADDDSRTSSMLDTTIDLVESLADKYNIDRHRFYVTGQSGGCMMAIAMNIRYPDLFAASFLVAGQWDPNLVKPLAKQKLWILVSQDDDKAWPAQNAITQVLEQEGAKISRAVWDGTWTPEEFRRAFEKIDAEGSPINFTALRKGTVIPPGESAAGASGHRNTWRIAYTIEPIREWIFRQRR